MIAVIMINLHESFLKMSYKNVKVHAIINEIIKQLLLL